MTTVLVIVVLLFCGVGALALVTAATADCATRPPSQFEAAGRRKVAWLLLILLLPVVGAVAYLAVARRGLQAAEDEGAPGAGDGSVGPLPRWLPWTAFVVTLAGLADSAYLTYDHFTATLPVCRVSGPVNCALVTTSRFSHVFGIPVALLGLLFYVALTVVNSPATWKAPWRWPAWLRAAMMVSGIGFVFYLINSELTLRALCEWCTGVHVITFTLFVITALTTPAILAAGGPYGDGDGADDESEAEAGGSEAEAGESEAGGPGITAQAGAGDPG